jgi:hypothetical protein
VLLGQKERGGRLGWAKRERGGEKRGLGFELINLYDFQNLTHSNKNRANQSMMNNHLLFLKLLNNI